MRLAVLGVCRQLTLESIILGRELQHLRSFLVEEYVRIRQCLL